MKSENIGIEDYQKIHLFNTPHNILTAQNRPLPSAPTHSVIVDVLNVDCTIKRISINININDSWKNGDRNINKAFKDKKDEVFRLIEHNLRFLNLDKMGYCYTSWMIDLRTQKVVYESKSIMLNPFNNTDNDDVDE
jgi:hypothetical protein